MSENDTEPVEQPSASEVDMSCLVKSFEDFRLQYERDGYPDGVHYKCPACNEYWNDDGSDPVGGLEHWQGYAHDVGGSGWMCVKCDCGNHYAMDTST